jgi:hypothetical protein
MIKHQGGTVWNGSEWRMNVTDEAGLPVFTLRFAADDLPKAKAGFAALGWRGPGGQFGSRRSGDEPHPPRDISATNSGHHGGGANAIPNVSAGFTRFALPPMFSGHLANASPYASRRWRSPYPTTTVSNSASVGRGSEPAGKLRSLAMRRSSRGVRKIR